MDRRLMGHEARRADCLAPPEETHNAFRRGGREAGKGTTRRSTAWFAIPVGNCGPSFAKNKVTRVTGSASTRQRTFGPAVTRMRLIAAPRHGDAPLTRNMEILNK